MPAPLHLWHAVITLGSHAGLAGCSSRGVGSGTQGRHAHGSQTHINARRGRWTARGSGAVAVSPHSGCLLTRSACCQCWTVEADGSLCETQPLVVSPGAISVTTG